MNLLNSKKIDVNSDYSLRLVLGSDVLVRQWTINKLPNDKFSIDNATIMASSKRWPLMIDPQGQANRWIRNMLGEKKKKKKNEEEDEDDDDDEEDEEEDEEKKKEEKQQKPLKVCKQNESSFGRTLENCITYGFPLLLENVPEDLDPLLEPILQRQIIKQGGCLVIRLGDNYIEYDPNFHLYITTTLPNPHFPPDVCVQVNLINFVATQEALSDQMLGIVVKAEKRELEERREKLVVQDAQNRAKLEDIENMILTLLANSEGNILDDEVLIKTLAQSKKTSNDVMQQMRVAERTKKVIESTRKEYKPVAFQSSHVFFCIADLCRVDPMYQYSLEYGSLSLSLFFLFDTLFTLSLSLPPIYIHPPTHSTHRYFVNIFKQAIEKAGVASSIKQRSKNINQQFLLELYTNVCQSLFEKDKLLFSFLLCLKLMQIRDEVSADEVAFILRGSLAMSMSSPNPVSRRGENWLSDQSWQNVLELSRSGFDDFKDRFVLDLAKWKEVVFSGNPFEVSNRILKTYDENMPLFKRIMVLRCLRPDSMIGAVQTLVAKKVGKEFVETPQSDLSLVFENSNCCSPLIFILSSGVDPMSELLKLAEDKGHADRLETVSLGQGQGPRAEAAVSKAVDTGSWVCLQNCHLAASWMSSLEKLCENLTPETVQPTFRLWLTSMPSKDFPVSVLQNSVKLTKEAPKGVRANLLGSYRRMDPEFLTSCDETNNARVFRKLLFGLCFFHAVVRERSKYGPIGWNIPYSFSEPDLKISQDQLQIFCCEQEIVPYAAINYLVAHCNYGGRVTDDKDRRCIETVLTDFYTEKIVDDAYRFSPSGMLECDMLEREAQEHRSLFSLSLSLSLVSLASLSTH